MLSPCSPTTVPPPEASPEPFMSLHIGTNSATTTTKNKKRRLAGTPDLDAEVVALSPRTLLAQDNHFVCEFCGESFRRDQNLQMHRRRHSAPPPWEPLGSGSKAKAKAAAPAPTTKRCVYVCPEPSCRFHDPARALGDLCGIKKHFRRKHGGRRRWTCARCSRAYAVLTDYKAHVRTCGDRGHSCGACGRVFTRAERLHAHQRTCRAGETSPLPGLGVVDASQLLMHAAAGRASPFSAESHTDAASAANVGAAFHGLDPVFTPLTPPDRPVVHDTEEMQLMPRRGSCARGAALDADRSRDPTAAVFPQSMWFGGARGVDGLASASVAAARVKSREQLRLAMAENAAAEEARAQARREVELAEEELAIARRARQQAQAEFNSAHELRDHAVRQVRAAMLLQAQCYSCRHKCSARAPTMSSSTPRWTTTTISTTAEDTP
ncbi:hypothetical protein EJB05_24556 [Eragrostis curvula]|uniref:C2H2-type domain-containing protein n=1 Tax=Eragrostis curvula TaxID=38414 RepID=A0A5J9V9L5_9POAL|nr:hypothetical protein EJB05_24556 [Eragrostis curvula]